jgi:hypothetical protein
MKLRITLDMFSGRPNPTVELEGDAAKDLLRRARPGRRLDEEEPDLPESLLGYRGVVIEQLEDADEELPRSFRVIDGSLRGRGLAHRSEDDSLEDYLLRREGPFAKLDSGEVSFLEAAAELKVGLRERIKKWEFGIYWPDPLGCACGPLYEPGWWNVPSRQPLNNCYNYGTNYRTNTFAQPGKAAGAQYTSLACNAVRTAAIADELIDAPTADNKCPSEGHLVALVVAPGYDFHWYRKGRDGWWTHKPGGTAVTNLDNAGKKILDPRTADRGPYTDFCTFMVVRHGHIRIS